MRRGGVTFKIFTITAVLLVVSALLIYLTLYFLLPGYYKSLKQSRLESGVNELVQTVDGKDYADAIPLILQFGQDHNAMLRVRDANGQMLLPADLMRFIEGAGAGIDFPGFRKLRPNQERYLPERAAATGMNMLTVSRTIHFAESDESFTLTVNSPLQPIDEASEVILRFLPYMLIAILLIAVGGASIYSRLIARPLLGLNNVARRLAKLDFSAAANPLKSGDEIGELSQSLSKLATNLRSTMAELQEANAQLKDDIEQEREQEKKRREFVATISHELKTPITAVSGQLEAMIGNVGIYRDRDTYLRQSYKIMRDMDKLVHEILDLSKLESRDFLPQMRQVDLAGLVRESVDNISYLAEVKDMKIACELPPEAVIAADERLMAKAVSNIIGNAVQYSGDGEQVYVRIMEVAEPMNEAGLLNAAGRTGGNALAAGIPNETAEMKGSPGKRQYRLEVVNTGAHLDEAKLPRLFEPFYRIEESRSRATGGSGLGLYIVSKVLDAHSASYGIENTPLGVMFSVTLKAA